MASHVGPREALRVVHENFPWVMQKRNEVSGEWENYGPPMKGRSTAYSELNKKKRGDPENAYRVLPKNEADKYREGLSAGRKQRNEAVRTRKPLLALPENL